MNSFGSSIKIAFRALKAHQGRAILTLLGIVIGIGLVVIVMSAGNAIRGFVIGQVESFGSDIINVEIRVPGTQNTVGISVTTLKIGDADAIRQIPNIAQTYAGFLSQAAVSSNGITKKSMIFGASATFPEVDAITLTSGRFYTEQEDAGLARVVVLGSDVAESFFGDADPVGESVRINSASYRVIGVIEKRGAAGFFDRDNIVMMPIRTVQKVIAGVDHVSLIISKMIEPTLDLETKAEIETLMRERHRISDPEKDDFIVHTIDEAKELVGTVLSGIQILLIALASISLVVGGVGIMNIMYVSVSERTYEIGLRKAVGANNKDILMQFLSEALVVTVIGGVLGVLFGMMASYAVALIARAQGFDWSFVISWQSIALSVGFSLAVGLLFGLYPARKASKLSPIVALRYE